MLRFAAIAVVGLFLSGCAMPVPLQVVSWAADGISYVATQKSVLDHGLSAMNGADCALVRLATEGAVCRDEDRVASRSTPDAARGFQVSRGFSNASLTCGGQRISVGPPTDRDLQQCAEHLVDEFGDVVALEHSQWRMQHFVDQRDMGGADVWRGVALAVRDQTGLDAEAYQVAEGRIVRF